MRSLVALVFICMFLPKAEPLRCYTCDPTNCVEYRTQTCSEFSDSCLNITGNVLGQQFVLKTCAPKQICNVALPSFSGFTLQSATCCQGDLCNGAERFTAEPLRCYTCDPTNCVEYRTQTCSAFSDSCFSVAGNVLGQQFVLKTCAPKQICNVALPSFSGFTLQSPTCCQADLCNGAERFTLSLLMFVPMLSFFLFP